MPALLCPAQRVKHGQHAEAETACAGGQFLGDHGCAGSCAEGPAADQGLVG